MEEVALKAIGEFGVPAVISLFLLTKGTTAVTNLAAAVDKLSDTVAMTGTRLDTLERELRDVRSDVQEIKASLKAFLSSNS